MSRIGHLPITIPAQVKLSLADNQLTVEGPKGSLSQLLPDLISLDQQPTELIVKRADETAEAKSKHGLIRSLLANMVTGVTTGFEKRLELVGIGFKSQISGGNLQLNVGYSHPVNYKLAEDVKVEVDGNIVIVSGIDKQRVGQVAAEIRAIKKPEPYKGKGIKYLDEVISRKSGKGSKEGGADQ